MRVQVLLSTYNGKAYLKPQMDSLLEQDHPNVKILVRDDGSTDGTGALLRQYAAVNDNVRVLFGENVGVTQSFFQLLEQSSPTADYFALCDQDDVWRPDKVSRAVEWLGRSAHEVPALYCSRLTVVDEDMKVLGSSENPGKGLSFRNALVQSSIFGCSSVVNRPARNLLLREFPGQTCAHDWWIYLVVSALGTVLYDRESRILYRKHASNVSGITLGIRDTWMVKIRRFLKYGKLKLVAKQAEEFRRIYGGLLSEENKRVLDRFLESRKQFWPRLRYAFSCDVYRQSRRDHLILKVLIVLDRLSC